MLERTEKVILRDSPEAAQPVTVTAWKSSTGRLFFDEWSARYDGSTHSLCEDCGEPSEKPYTVCDSCRDLREEAKYEALPRAEWDGKAMLYSETKERYYSAPEYAEDDLEEGQTLADLRLVICEPNYARRLEPDDFADDLPEDGDTPDWLYEAINAFNQAIEKGEPLSWSPGKVALGDPVQTDRWSTGEVAKGTGTNKRSFS